MRILIIEDDYELARTIKEGLIQYGLICDLAHSANEGEEKISINSYDTILLDLNLPDYDGLDVLKDLRSIGVSTPVIIVTARTEIEQRARGLDLGADDYITKPFDFIELRARIQAVMRRSYGLVKNELKIGEITMNPRTREVYYNETKINLSSKEFDILEYIAMRYPDVVSSEDIAEHIYDEYFDPFSSVLRVHISNLKKKLKLSVGIELIQTIKGRGYKICIDQSITQKD